MFVLRGEHLTSLFCQLKFKTISYESSMYALIHSRFLLSFFLISSHILYPQTPNSLRYASTRNVTLTTSAQAQHWRPNVAKFKPFQTPRALSFYRNASREDGKIVYLRNVINLTTGGNNESREILLNSYITIKFRRKREIIKLGFESETKQLLTHGLILRYHRNLKMNSALDKNLGHTPS